MGRPEPCVLFSQSFIHPQLDEYVDEVIFAEPIVITACEFLEQNASSSSPMITLVGATSPPSFALEVFVQIEGEPRFRRLCQPFLYSHSSSNVLEVEAVVTNHLVVRGSYRSLTLVVYGNTAEDLGQFNIEFDLDNSLANLVCSPAEGKLEDLPPALNLSSLTFEQSICSPKSLSLPVAESDLSIEMKQFLHLTLKICQLSDHEDITQKLASIVASAISSYVSSNLCGTTTWNQHKQGRFRSPKRESQRVLTEARKELLELYKMLLHMSVDAPDELLGEGIILESAVDLPTPELLVDVFNHCFPFKRKFPTIGLPVLSQNENMIVGLSVVLLLCSGRESCFHFVNGGGMEQLAHFFSPETQKSMAITLMLLGVVERATRYAIGCEGFLGWWPREDENVPIGSSEGYSQLLKLLLQKQRHDVASLATYILHRLRSYEITSRYESAILSVLGNLSAVGRVTSVSLNSLATANSQLKRLLKLLNLRGPIEDPSPASSATRSLILSQSEGLLSYGATINLIASSKYCFSNWDIDTHLLSLLKERGFLPLSAALLSSPVLRSEIGRAMDIFVDIAASIEAILLSLLFCRSGLVFLLLQPEVSAAVILSLQGVDDVDKAECVPLRYAAVLISKGFICRVQEIGMVTDLHLRVVNAIDRLLTATPHSEELLWVLWELCALSRSDSGRQAVLALAYFPEAVVVLMETVRSIKELQPAVPNHGTSPLGLAIFHLASELFEIMVTDSTSSSLFAWIGHAVELHKALHSSSPGSNRKDAPMRLLEWIDAGVVYHKNGAVGLLRYAAVLASGGDAQLTSTSILVSDSMDVEKVVGDSASGSDVQVENLLGKLVSDKFFDGVPLRDSSIAQLTTTFRILAFISENSAVAAALYEEGAVMLIYVVLVNCKSMLERYSNSYDYLVDEGAESNSTSDLLLERSREQSLIDLMIPSLVLLITLLQKLQEAKEQHRNTKLLNALLHLHREVSPKLAARAADSSSPYPCSALGLGAVCRLIVSALACWPVFSWTPGLFHCLLESVQVTSSLALGPKEACSLLCLLGDLFPEEGIWLWKNGMPSLSDLRSLSIATLLGPERERDVDWYLQPGHLSVLLSRLTPLLDKIAQIVLHFAFTALVVIQDLLRVFIIRIACQKVDSALVLLRPIISWIDDHVSKSSSVSDKEIFKVHRLLDFVASLSEHPRGKALLLKEGAVGIFIKALQRCIDAFDSDGKLIPESRIPAKSDVSFLSWCFPVFKSLALICDPQTDLDHSAVYDKSSFEKLSIEDCSLIGCNLLKLCQFLPVGRELQACLIAFKELASTNPGRSALASIFEKVQSSSVEDVEAGRGKEVEENGNLSDEYNWRRCPPLLICWKNLLRSIEAKDGFSVYAIEAVSALCLVGSCLCSEGKNLEGILLLKCLFGLPCDLNGTDDYPEEKLKDVHELLALLDVRIGEDEYSKSPTMKTSLCQVKESVESMLLLLEKPVDSVKVENVTSSEGFPSSNEVTVPSKIFSLHSLMPSVIMMSTLDEEAGLAISRIRRSEGNAEKAGNYISLGGLADNFLWECPDSSPDRLSMPALPVKRKMTTVESSSRRLRGDNLGPENTGTNAFPRGLGPPTVSSGPTRRDTFRQRKPNTSRPPSMHVDDYVARERNVDGASSGSNVVNSVQRGGSTGGRPPSIHVDEFMARQRERQNPVAATVGEVAQVRSSSVENDNDSDKIDRSRQLKADLDDDLQEINIVFDEESESDDRLPFPQPDDNLPPASVIIGESSPRPIVDESENELNESSQFSHLGTPPATKTDGNLHSDLPLRRSVPRAEMPLAREPSISSEKHYPGMNSEKTFFHEQGDETKHTALLPTSKGFDASTATHLPAFPSQFYNKGPISSPVHPLGDSRPTQPAFYQKDSPHQATNVPLATGSQGFYDQKLPVNQPPLPPLPPPPAVSPIPSQSAEPVQTHSSPYGHSLRDAMPPLPTGHPLQAFNVSGPSTIPVLHVREDRPSAALLLPSASSSAFSDSLNPPFQPQIHTEYQSTAGTLLATPHPMLESKYSWATVSSGSRLQDEANPSTGSGRPPPLPPMPPPYSSPQVTQSSMKSSSSQSPLYNQTSVGIQLPLPSAPLTDSRLGAFSATSVGGSSLISYPLPPFGPPSMVARPTSIPGSLFTTAPMMQQQQGQNTPSLSLPAPNPQPSVVQSIQPRPPLQPLQPPLLRPPHLLQHHRLPSIQVSQPQSEQGIPLQQSPIQVQLPPLQQIQQQLPISQMHVYYQPQQQEHLSLLPQQLQVEQAQPQALHQQGDSASSQQQQDSGMTLQQYFSSPEAIQSLLSDRDKLCQLLEQHPKLMQMLQEKLGQL